MPLRRCFPSLAIVAVSMCTLAGCGPRVKQKPVFPVSGKVLFDRKPAGRALVIFHPLDESDPNAVKPRGEVADDGSFKLSTYGAGDGAPAGEYRVTVEWWLSSGRPNDDSPPANRLPQRYAVAANSGLKATIEQRSNELKPFELTR